MMEIDPAIIADLRELAGRGIPPSLMLREILDRNTFEEPRSLSLVLYCISAFDFELNQVNSIFGWYPYPGYVPELSDAKLDYFLGRHLKNAGWPVQVAETVPTE
jgi:hypothetical protein